MMRPKSEITKSIAMIILGSTIGPGLLVLCVRGFYEAAKHGPHEVIARSLLGSCCLCFLHRA